WVWKCDATNELCTRLPSQGNSNSETLYPSLEVCRLICGKYGSLWPQPTISTKISDELFMFPLSVIKFEFSIKDGEAKEILQGMPNIFLQLLSLEDTSNCPQTTNKVTIHITVNSDNISLDWSTNETYSLEVKTEGNQNSVQIISNTIYGARHALETLSQLTEFYPRNDGSTCLAMVDEVLIVDAPVYPHRGLLLDTARNFISVTSIKKHIDGMAASKLNVLHWHITDSQSFPLDLPNLPNMTKYGAYSADKIYHPNDIKELLSYAKLRGVRIIIEIDAPAHAGNGWQWGPQAGLGDLAVCINQQPFRSYCIESPCGQLNPVNPNLYTILKVLYNDIINMLPKGEVFHMGGDEVYIPCWNSTPEIIKFIGDKPRTTETFLDLWSSYQAQALKAYDAGVGNTNTPIILWTSHLTEIDVIEKYLPKERYIIQTWVPAADNLPKNLLALGYKIIVSTKDTWYLDHGFWGSTVYHNWRVVYNNKIPRDYGVLGGEVCMWGEYVDETSVESRTWPRAAAAAERLWTDSSISVNVAAKRFYRHRERLVSRGINAEALIPRWCYQNEGQC
ncbi:beta-N-acetylglucosaminidase NAG2, partial [Asbolus verrucosus]